MTVIGRNLRDSRESAAIRLAELSELFFYPGQEFKPVLASLLAFARLNRSEDLESLIEFESKVRGLELKDLEELYTRTFDLAPICVPYIGTYVFGEDNFERGALLSGLQRRYENEKDFNSSAEMPDHIGMILSFADRFEHEEFEELIEFCLLNALKKMTASLENTDNPYYFVLKAARELIESERGRKP